MSSSNAGIVADAQGVFGRVPLVLIGVVMIVADLGIGALIIHQVYRGMIPTMSMIASFGLLLVACLFGLNRWFQIRACRRSVIEQLEPGILRFPGKHPIPLNLDGLEPLSEQEQLSAYDQVDISTRSESWLDVVTYAVAVGVFLVFPISRDPQSWWIRSTMIALSLAVACRWLFLGDALIPGFNRLVIDPEGWEWGGWSRRLKKSGKWKDTRVLIQQSTKGGRERYFIVLGDEDGVVGIIVPRASMILIERAYVGDTSI